MYDPVGLPGFFFVQPRLHVKTLDFGGDFRRVPFRVKEGYTINPVSPFSKRIPIVIPAAAYRADDS
jgi:hypothetical protein